MTADQIRELAARANWQPENQQVWLERKGFDSWEAADEDTRDLAAEMIKKSTDMFGLSSDEQGALRVYDGTDAATD